ncbi:MAG: hypothetical protein SPL39_06665, partial [Selenomonadaceae bacterium]|nr:hypothetical protein [Selenomonadaceae bacterium]
KPHARLSADADSPVSREKCGESPACLLVMDKILKAYRGAAGGGMFGNYRDFRCIEEMLSVAYIGGSLSEGAVAVGDWGSSRVLETNKYAEGC